MNNDQFKRWIECQQGLKWSTIPIAGRGSRMKMDKHIHLHTKGLSMHSFGQCIQLGFGTKASFKTASKLVNQQL